MQNAQTEMEPTTAHAMMVMKAMALTVQVGSLKISYKQINEVDYIKIFSENVGIHSSS